MFWLWFLWFELIEFGLFLNSYEFLAEIVWKVRALDYRDDSNFKEPSVFSINCSWLESS